MGELEEKLGRILADQGAMEQIMSLAKSLGAGQAGKGPGEGAPQTAPPPPAAPQPIQSEGGLLDALGQVDPSVLAGAARLLGEYHRSDDSRTALLAALRPFVKERRYAKLDKAIQIAKLSRLIRMALELLHPREESDV